LFFNDLKLRLSIKKLTILLFSILISFNSYGDCSSAESEAYYAYKYAKKAYRSSDLSNCTYYAKKAYRQASYAESEASSCN